MLGNFYIYFTLPIIGFNTHRISFYVYFTDEFGSSKVTFKIAFYSDFLIFADFWTLNSTKITQTLSEEKREQQEDTVVVSYLL